LFVPAHSGEVKTCFAAGFSDSSSVTSNVNEFSTRSPTIQRSTPRTAHIDSPPCVPIAQSCCKRRVPVASEPVAQL
jgi:hypothetical protein